MATDQDIETAFLEVTRVFDLALKLPDLIPSVPLEQSQSEAGFLYNEVLQCLNMALSILSPKAKDSGDRIFSDKTNVKVEEEQVVTPLRRCKPRRENSVISSRKVTNAPFDDGYLWRKYGQKEIKKSKYTKSYYRCANISQNCPAKKQVQQDSDDPSLYHLVYYNQHACSNQTNLPPLDLVLDFPQTNNSFLLTFANGKKHHTRSVSPTYNGEKHNRSATNTTSTFASGISYGALENPVTTESISTSGSTEVTQALVSFISSSINSDEINSGNRQEHESLDSSDILNSTASNTTESAEDINAMIEELFEGNPVVETSNVFDQCDSELDDLRDIYVYLNGL